MANNIVLIGTENRGTHELFQLLNWRFRVNQYYFTDNISVEELKRLGPSLIIVNMEGNLAECRELFQRLEQKCREIPVLTISTQSESNSYESFYAGGQFHKVLRPITGKRLVEICRAVIAGKDYVQKQESCVGKNEKQHILIVDDNAMVLRNIKSILEQRYSVAVAPSGIHAFVSIGKKMPDLILLDYEMPEMNGKEVMEKLQADEEFVDIPIIFLTSMDSKEIVMELLALRPAGYILKPVDSQILLDRIEGIIGK